MRSDIRRIFVLSELAAAVMVVACGGGADEREQPMASKERPLAAPAQDLAADTESTSGMDFPTRCAQPGVVKCVGFDDVGDFSTGSGGTNGAYGFNSGIIPPSGTSDYTRATRDTGVKASGNSALKFTIPSNSGSDSSGTFFTNFSKDLSVQFDGNQEFFVQWRQRFSPEFIGTAYEGAGGFKQIIVGTGDQAGTIYSSCSSLELPLFSYQQKGFPVMYNSCTGSSAHGAYDGFYEPYNAYDFKLQNGRDGAGCLYSQKSTGYFPPNGNCFGYVANEWMTFQMQVKLGPRVGDVFQNSYVTLWGAREGKPSELVIKWGPYSLAAGSPAANERYGKVWLLPYNTGKSTSQTHPTAYTWYDELIVSRSKIDDPVASPAPTPVPYSVPAVGQALAIGVNTADSVRPQGYASSNWAYSLFNSYGTGTFLPDYSSAGAFVLAGTGGHTAPANVDAAIFDFSDAQWKLRSNANGIAAREADYSVGETTGAPYYELPGATAGQIPIPAHLYQSVSYIPSSLGGGPKGSYLMMRGSASAKESRQADGIHRMDLSTGLWTRVTNDTLSYTNTSPVASAVYDPATKRYYLIHDAFHAQNYLLYLDANDWRVKQTPTYAYPPGQQGPGYQTAFLDPVRHLLISQRRGFPLRALDLNNIPAGWVPLTMSGTQPAEFENLWAFYEPDGRFYTRGNKSGQTLTRLTPPTGDWKTGVWTYTDVTVGGATMPNHTTTGGEVAHYGTFFYVPALRSLAWIAGESSKVILLKPPA